MVVGQVMLFVPAAVAPVTVVVMLLLLLLVLLLLLLVSPLSLFVLESIDTSPFMCAWQIHGSRMPLFRPPKRRSTFAAHPRLNLSDGTTVLVVPAAATLRLVVELLQLLHVRAAPSPGRPSICARQP